MATQLPDDLIAIITLQLTFGGAPYPFKWGIILEIVCDLANKLLKSKDWEPQDLYASVQWNIPVRKYLSNNIPFAIGRHLMVDIPIYPRGYADDYINNMMGPTVNLPITMNGNWLEAVIPLAIKVPAQPNNANEPIPHKKMISTDKLKMRGDYQRQNPFSNGVSTSDHSPWPSQNTNTLPGHGGSNWWSRRAKQQRKCWIWWLETWATLASWSPGFTLSSAVSDHCSCALGTGGP